MSLDWLPWHHTWGGNSNLNGAIRVAGTLYIDGGRPLPGRFQETLENLRELSPSSFGTVPAAYPLLLEALERDADLRAKFFKNMRGLGYGGALLPQESFDRLQGVAAEPARRAPAVRLRLGHDRDHQHRPHGLLERRPRRAFSACRSPACWPSWCRRVTATSCA